MAGKSSSGRASVQCSTHGYQLETCRPLRLIAGFIFSNLLQNRKNNPGPKANARITKLVAKPKKVKSGFSNGLLSCIIESNIDIIRSRCLLIYVRQIQHTRLLSISATFGQFTQNKREMQLGCKAYRITLHFDAQSGMLSRKMMQGTAAESILDLLISQRPVPLADILKGWQQDSRR